MESILMVIFEAFGAYEKSDVSPEYPVKKSVDRWRTAHTGVNADAKL